jgi:hypothetical protein
MAVLQLPMLIAWVRFPSPAPSVGSGKGYLNNVNKIFKQQLKVFAALNIIGFFLIVAFITLVEPSYLKETIQNEVAANTGCVLSIQGPMRWRTDSGIALELEDVALSNAPFVPHNFVLIKKARFGLNIGSIFSGKIRMDIQLSHIAVNFEQNIAEDLRWAHANFALNTFKVEDFKINVLKTGDVVDMASYSFKTEGAGQHRLTLQADFSNPTSKFTFTHHGEDFDINHLLSLLKLKDKIEGKAFSKVKLQAEGNTIDMLLASLSGEMDVSVSDGKLLGIELPTLLQHAQQNVKALLGQTVEQKINLTGAFVAAELEEWKKQALNGKALSTSFNNIEINLLMNKGIIDKAQTRFMHPKYTVNGRGTLDLIHKKILYEAQALLHSASEGTNDAMINSTPLTIQIKGSLGDPLVRPDFITYVEKMTGTSPKNGKESNEKEAIQPFEKLFETAPS